MIYPQPMTAKFIGLTAEGYADVFKWGVKMKFNLRAI